jgi:formate dehydrogenase major subunit
VFRLLEARDKRVRSGGRPEPCFRDKAAKRRRKVVELSRRDFLKFSGAATAGGLLIYKALDAETAAASASVDLHKEIGEVTTICCYCGVGCGAIAAAEDDRVINIEGDPEHPINEGSLCSKGQALTQMRTVDGNDNPNRLTKPLYRAPNSTEWEEKSWDWMIDTIAARIKETRDSNWLDTVDVGGTTYNVNRTDAIANFGGGELDNEECYLLVKMARALGLVYLEHCARI